MHSLIIASFGLLSISHVSAQCNLITGNRTCLVTPDCVWIVDDANTGERCGDIGVCADDCSGCDMMECSSGVGGGNTCFFDSNLGGGTCVGDTCDTNCEICTQNGGRDLCEASFAPPHGCVWDTSVPEPCAPAPAPPTSDPTINPTQAPSNNPSNNPTQSPSRNPTQAPSNNPSTSPTTTVAPSRSPSTPPTIGATATG